jgi:superfamily II DNA or RNA helicase
MMRLTFDPQSMQDYERFIAVKRLPHYRVDGRVATFPDAYAERLGLVPIEVPAGEYRPKPFLFDYQDAISRIAVKKRRYALFADCGLGKTVMFLEFARHALGELSHDQCVLIVSPLMVIDQTIAEAERFYGDTLPIAKIPSGQLDKWLQSGDGRLGITNYEAFKNDVPRGRLGACILDESSILKSHYGKIAKSIIGLCKGLDWKLCSTGTPAPNDRQEYANHALFLESVRSVNEFLARYFVNRGETGNRWEIKPHGLRAFYRHLSHFSIFLVNPDTYGWSDNANNLPPVHVHIEEVDLTTEQADLCYRSEGKLFATDMGGITNRTRMSGIGKGYHKGKRIATLKPGHIAGTVDKYADESIIIWCLYNHEQQIIREAISDAASIDGQTPIEERMDIIRDFKSGKVRVLISKPKILGFGLNLQICTRMIFSGLQDSYESFYQAVKRCNRYGSTEPLNVHIPVTDVERPMVETVLVKARRVQNDTEQQERMFASEYFTD